MMRRPAVAGAILLLAITVSGCAGGAMSEPSGSMSDDRSATPMPTSSPGSLSPSAAPTGDPVDPSTAQWDAIVADLADRGVTATPTVVSSEAVTFSDGSLGCPSPGVSYTQALVEGTRIVVEADGKSYDYRFGADAAPKLCESR